MWGMTNDIRELKQYIINKDCNLANSPIEENKSVTSINEKKDNGFTPNPNRSLKKGDTVINISNGEEMVINEVGFDGSCICYIGKKMVGIFPQNEIATKDEYSNYMKTKNDKEILIT